VPFLRLYSNIW